MRIRRKIAIVGLGSLEGPAFIDMQADLDQRDRSRDEAVRTAVERGFPEEEAIAFPTVIVDPDEAEALMREGIAPRLSTTQIVRDCGIAEGTPVILAGENMTTPVIVVIDARWHDRHETPPGGIRCLLDGKLDATLTRKAGGPFTLTVPVLSGEPACLTLPYMIDGMVVTEALRRVRGMAKTIDKWRPALTRQVTEIMAGIVEQAAQSAANAIAGEDGLAETEVGLDGVTHTTILREDGMMFDGPSFRFDGVVFPVGKTVEAAPSNLSLAA